MSHLCIILKQEDLSIMYNSRQGEFECGNSQEAAMFLIGSTTASVEFYFQWSLHISRVKVVSLQVLSWVYKMCLMSVPCRFYAVLASIVVLLSTLSLRYNINLGVAIFFLYQPVSLCKYIELDYSEGRWLLYS